MGYGRHLRQRGATTHFRRAIPKDIAARFGRREIVRSIGALPAFERHSLCRRFCLACDEVFGIVRSQTALSRAEIDRLVTAYIDDVARREREFESWQPRRAPGEAEFRRDSQIAVFTDLARGVMAARRTRAGGIADEVLFAAAEAAGVKIEGDLDAHLAEDAVMEALALHYGQRAEDLRRERNVGAPNLWARFLKRVAGGDPASAAAKASPSVAGGPRPTRANTEIPREVSEQGASDDLASGPTDGILDPGSERTGDSQNEELPEEAPSAPLTQGAPGETFGNYWDQFVETKLDIRKDWKPSRRPELLATRRLWIWIVGDLPLFSCGAAQIRQFHDKYLLLPEDYTELRKSKRGVLSPAEVIAAAKQREANVARRKRTEPKPYVRVNPKTFNKHLGNLKAFFAWAPVANLRPAGETDPTQGFHIAVDKSTAAVRAERHMAPVEAIRELFQSPYWTGRSSTYFMTRPGNVIVRDAMYWIPLIIAFHGLRREEASQLRVRHIKSEMVGKAEERARVWYFDLAALDLDLKAPDGGSPRRVPFHREFEKLGFLEDKVNGRRAEDLLFPELSNDNAHSAFGESIGKRFGNYVRSVRFSDASFSDLLTLQALRHTVRTLLDNTEAKEVYVDELIGHESEGRRSEGRRYRKGIDLINLKDAIDLLELPIEAEQLRLFASRSR